MPSEADPGSMGLPNRALHRMNAFLDQRLAPLEARGDSGDTQTAFDIAPVTLPSPASGGWISPLRSGFRRNLLSHYRDRAGEKPRGAADLDFGAAIMPGSPAAAGPVSNWMPIGPSVVRHGQATTRPPVSGRIDGIAVAAGGKRVYVASANGGVWRSDDGGKSWRATMDALESNVPAAQSDSLACGAIAIHPTNPDTIYVGTGEPFGSLDSYFGAGPEVSLDGGATWNRETADPNSATLDGTGFFRLAVDPNHPGRVVAATKNGIYRREPAPGQAGVFQWFRKKGGVSTSVVSNSTTGATTFYAALIPGGVFRSTDGDVWSSTGSGLPESLGVVSLATHAEGLCPVYALITNPASFQIQGVFRLDAGSAAWVEISGHPPDLFGPVGQEGQGWYDSAIAVAPDDDSMIFLGGGSKSDAEGASFFRCKVTPAGQAPQVSYSMKPEWIGSSVHADIHALEFTPGDPSQLWAGCDGGLFFCGAPHADNVVFEPRNAGLATLTMNHLGMHPTEDAVLYCGVQDNGTVRYTSSEAWLHSAPGDGGFVVVHPDKPNRVLRSYIMNFLEVALDGGSDYNSWEPANVPLDTVHGESAEFYPPLEVGPHGLVAFGTRRLWISDFGANWKSIPSGAFLADDCGASITAILVQSASRIYAGTASGAVYRFDCKDGVWTRKEISETPLLRGRIQGIALDYADGTGNSMYICFGGGPNDFRHVWHFDGAAWTARSGPDTGEPTSLLPVQHNAIATDPANPSCLFAAADLGVWRSSDGGQNWLRFTEGLPEAAVIDLKLHPTRRLLWASTHGRGVFERAIDIASSPIADFYIRDTILDTGRRATTDGLDNPAAPGMSLFHTDSPDIKVDVPVNGAFQTASAQIDFLQFEDILEDHSSQLRGGSATVNRVFVQVHNRARFESRAQVMLLLATNPVGALPASFEKSVVTGVPVQADGWKTVGIAQTPGVVAGDPVIVAFNLPSSLLPVNPAGLTTVLLLAILHSEADPFTSTTVNVDALVLADKKVAEKKLTFG